MAGTSLLALIDDIASLLDDVAGLTKTAAHKSAGVLGDDLALNAQQVTGIQPNRELPVVFGVAKGSAVNKLILVPAALAVSALAPWAVTPLLMVGGTFLCFEGVEKVVHKLFGHDEAGHADEPDAASDPQALEQRKVKGAIRTDFILSAEIIVISLGTMTEAPFLQRLGALAAIGVLMTVGVYGLVAAIVKLDDLGLSLSRSESSTTRALGRGVLSFAPLLMRFLGVAGTAAMFLVGGGILSHGIEPLHHAAHAVAHAAEPAGLAWLAQMLFDGLVGIVAGAVVLGVVLGVKRFRSS